MNFCFVIDELLAASSQPGSNRRLPNYLSLYKENGVKVLYSLAKRIDLPSEFEKQYKTYFFKINDYEVPTMDELDSIVDTILAHMKKNEPVNVSCSTGIGKSSMVITAVLMKHKNITKDEAIKIVAEHRYVSLEDGTKELLKQYEQRVVVKEELEAAS